MQQYCQQSPRQLSGRGAILAWGLQRGERTGCDLPREQPQPVIDNVENNLTLRLSAALLPSQGDLTPSLPFVESTYPLPPPQEASGKT